MTILEVLERIQSLLALRLDAATKRVYSEPTDFTNGYWAGVADCLKTVNELMAGEKRQ